jgi:ribonuclease-3 family protein
MKEEFDVTLREQQVLSRGRNSVSGSKNRRNPAAYQDATALEALVGYLYITDSRRCEELLNWINNNLDRVN